jgi:hypothetical protein
MIFKYDASKLKEYRKNGILFSIPFFILIPFLSVFIYSEILDNSIFLTLLTILFIYIAGGIGILIGYKSAKKEFESFKIEINNDKILINSKMQHKEINIKNITKIKKDKKYYYIIVNKINKIKIINYIENNEEFEKHLNSITAIENYNSKYNIIEYIPVILYIVFLFIARYGTIKLYLIFAILLIISLIYSSIKIILNQLNIKWKIFSIIIYGYILYMVINGLYTVIKYIRL